MESEAARQLDRVMDHRMVRNPVEPEELVDPKTEQRPRDRWDLALVGAGGNEFIEGSSPSKHSKDQLLGEASICGLKPVEHAVLLESAFREITRFLLSDKKQDGKFSWCGNHREGILPVLR